MSKSSVGQAVKKHMMTGVSYMIPVIAMAGLLEALGTMFGGVKVGSNPKSIAGMIYLAGTTAMNFVVPILAAYIAYSIADRPGIAPGLLVGALALSTKSGFLGGIIGGFFIGYLVLYIKKYIKVPKSVQPLMSVLIIPLIAGLIGSFLMIVIIGPPIGIFVTWGEKHLVTMGKASKFFLGAMIGGLVGIDMAGPIGKIGTTVANGLMADGIFGPEGAKVCSCMVPPLALGISSVFISKKKYTIGEREAGKTAILLGLSQITEGGLPFLLSDPLRVIPCTVIGAGISGGLAMVFGVTSPVPMGGIFAMPVMGNILGAIISVVVGVIVTVILLALIKKNVPENTTTLDDSEEDDDSELDINITE